MAWKRLEDRALNDDRSKKVRNKIAGIFLAMTFVVLPAVSIFSTFACQDFGDDYGKFMKVDYSIACDDGAEYWFFWLYAIAMIFVYPLGTSDEMIVPHHLIITTVLKF